MEESNKLLFGLCIKRLSEGVVLCDADGEIVYINPAAETIRNIIAAERIGKNVLDCHAAESQEKVRRALEHIKTKKDASFHRMIFDEQNQKVYRNTYTALFDDQQKFQGLAIISRDMTKEHELEGKRGQESRSQEITITNLKNQYESILIASIEMLSNVLEAKDVYTDGHSKRVTKYATFFYEHLFGLNKEYYDIEIAAKLHDIGKVGLPDSIIQKPDKLTAEEYKLVKRHPVIAADLVAKIDPGQRITPIIKHHHEQYDGSGYPDGLCGEAIPLGARIIALADSFDAMRSSRPYRQQLSIQKCLQEITDHAGTQFDPYLAKEFRELILTGSID